MRKMGHQDNRVKEFGELFRIIPGGLGDSSSSSGL